MSGSNGPQDGAEALYAHIRRRIAFENMVAAVLAAAVIGGGIVFVVELMTTIAGARFGINALGRTIFGAIAFSFAAFLGGFLGSVVVGLPLFAWLERNENRARWPYYIAACAITLAILFLMGRAGSLITVDTVKALAPGPIAAFLFTRRIDALRAVAAPSRAAAGVRYLN